MVQITISNPCSCVKKRKSWTKELVLLNLQEAQDLASKMLIQGNKNFCKRHSFSLHVKNDSIEITAELRK